MFRKKKDPLREVDAILLDHENRIAALVANAALLEETNVEDSLTPEDETGVEECAPSPIVVPTWNEMVARASKFASEEDSLDSLLTQSDCDEIDSKLAALNEEFAAQHRLDKFDIGIAVMSGILAAAVDMFLVGVPARTHEQGLRAQPLENYVRDQFKKWLPEDEMKKLAATPAAKVPYEAQYNAGFTETWVEGLYPTMHRLYSLGHDPLLGFVVGVGDILNGTITTVDKTGNVVVQQIGRYTDRKASTVAEALIRQFIHLKTDVNTAMGLPAPLMGLFNIMQFGELGTEKQTVAEIVQGMYYEGYDFEHFCAQSIPTMLAEIAVRVSYFSKRIHEGHSVKESIPFSKNREKHPKLATMLFLAHSVAAGIDAGRIYFSKNPMELSYPEMATFAVYAMGQLKWSLVKKPNLRHKHIMQALDLELQELAKSSEERLENMKGFEFIFA